MQIRNYKEPIHCHSKQLFTLNYKVNYKKSATLEKLFQASGLQIPFYSGFISAMKSAAGTLLSASGKAEHLFFVFVLKYFSKMEHN